MTNYEAFLFFTTIYGTPGRHLKDAADLIQKHNTKIPDHTTTFAVTRAGFLFMFLFLVFFSPDFYTSLAQRLHFRTHCHSVACISFQRAFRCRTLTSKKNHERRDSFTVYTCSYHMGGSNDGFSWEFRITVHGHGAFGSELRISALHMSNIHTGACNTLFTPNRVNRILHQLCLGVCDRW